MIINHSPIISYHARRLPSHHIILSKCRYLTKKAPPIRKALSQLQPHDEIGHCYTENYGNQRSISTNSLPQQRQPHKKIPQPIKKVSDRTKATDSLCRHYPILTPPFSDSRLSFLLFQLSRSLTCSFVIHPSERQKCFSDIRKPALSPVCTVLYEYCLTTTWWITYRSVG